MAIVILAVLVGIPLIDITLFIIIGAEIGIWPTLAGIVLTAVIGIILIRLQGLPVINRLRRSQAQRERPVAALVDAGCLLVAGLLLLTPGFLTDAIGFLLVVPPVRHWIGHRLRSRFRHHGMMHHPASHHGNCRRNGPGQPVRPAGATSGITAVDPENSPPSDTSPWNKGVGNHR